MVKFWFGKNRLKFHQINLQDGNTFRNVLFNEIVTSIRTFQKLSNSSITHFANINQPELQTSKLTIKNRSFTQTSNWVLLNIKNNLLALWTINWIMLRSLGSINALNLALKERQEPPRNGWCRSTGPGLRCSTTEPSRRPRSWLRKEAQCSQGHCRRLFRWSWFSLFSIDEKQTDGNGEDE